MARSKLKNNPLFQVLEGASGASGAGGASSRKAKKGAVSKSKVKKNANPLALALQSAKNGKSRNGKSRNGKSRSGNKAADNPGKTGKAGLISFVAASEPLFLRINNLAPAVTAAGVSQVMSEYGTVVKAVVKNQGTSTMAEVFYLKEENMSDALAKLHGQKVDNRVLRLEIGNKSKVITNAKSWRGITKQVQHMRSNQARK